MAGTYYVIAFGGVLPLGLGSVSGVLIMRFLPAYDKCFVSSGSGLPPVSASV